MSPWRFLRGLGRAPAAVVLLEDLAAVIVEIDALLGTKRLDPRRVRKVPDCENARIQVPRNQNQADIREGDVAAIEQVRDVRREQQPVVAIEFFPVIRFAPGFDVTRHEVAPVEQMSEPAAALDLLEIAPVKALPAARTQEVLLGDGIEIAAH